MIGRVEQEILYGADILVFGRLKISRQIEAKRKSAY